MFSIKHRMMKTAKGWTASPRERLTTLCTMNWKFEEGIALLQNRWEDIIQSLGQTHSHLFWWCSGKTKTYWWSPSVYWLLCRNGREGAGSDLPALTQLMSYRRAFPLSLRQSQIAWLALLFLSSLHLWEHLSLCFSRVTVSAKANYTSLTSFTLLHPYVGHPLFSLDFDSLVWAI